MKDVFHTRLAEGWRLPIPAKLCKQLGIEPGDPVTIERRNGELHIIPYMQLIREIQEGFAPYKTPGVDEVDELIRERREEAARENDE